MRGRVGVDWDNARRASASVARAGHRTYTTGRFCLRYHRLVAQSRNQPTPPRPRQQLAIPRRLHRKAAPFVSPCRMQSSEREKITCNSEPPSPTRRSRTKTRSKRSPDFCRRSPTTTNLSTRSPAAESAMFASSRTKHPTRYISQGHAHETIGVAEIADFRRSSAAAALAKAQQEISARGLTDTVVQLYYGLLAAEAKEMGHARDHEAGRRFSLADQQSREWRRGGALRHHQGCIASGRSAASVSRGAPDRG